MSPPSAKKRPSGKSAFVAKGGFETPGGTELSTNSVLRIREAVVILRMGQPNAEAHLQPLANALAPGTLHVIRPEPKPPSLAAPNIQYWEVRGTWRIVQIVKVLLRGLIVARRCDVDLLMSFNGYPYGVLTSLISLGSGKPFHIGLIGSDLELLRRPRWWWPLARRAAVITIPGPGLRHRLVDRGYQGLVFSLPHGVDTTRFHPGEERDIACLFVGFLIPLKRVDLMLEAISVVVKRLPSAQTVIVGDGPLKEQLIGLSADLGVSSSVEFVGFQERPEQWMRRAQCIIFPSEWEGLPFAMIEAMRCGAVPIASPVGSIPDLLEDRRNGRLLHEMSVEILSSTIIEVLEDDGDRASMSHHALLSTSNFTYGEVREAWRHILSSVGNT